jgi:GNAT superfamily N-acetyltransferase
MEVAPPAIALALEYGRWAAQVAKVEYGIDADAETETGLSTSIEDLLGPRCCLYVAEAHDEPLGIGGLKAVSNDVAEMKRVYVRPEARGLGIGRMLVARVIEDARGFGFRSIRLESAAFMREAHALYRAFGFVEIAPYAGREFEGIPGAEEIQVFMALDLVE